VSTSRRKIFPIFIARVDPKSRQSGIVAKAVLAAVTQNILNTEWCELLDKILYAYNGYVKWYVSFRIRLLIYPPLACGIIYTKSPFQSCLIFPAYVRVSVSCYIFYHLHKQSKIFPNPSEHTNNFIYCILEHTYKTIHCTRRVYVWVLHASQMKSLTICTLQQIFWGDEIKANEIVEKGGTQGRGKMHRWLWEEKLKRPLGRSRYRWILLN
jgi:hypothetical protein